MAELVYAYNTSGDARLVPSSWIGHPVIQGWSLTPPEPPAVKTRTRSAEPPRSGEEE